ncbi:DUF3857 domain-containing protein [Flavobacterium pallidum]|uniref:DUF3857 domain-containing protein n=1 Tax=Flavobacterium pallidum TaxID=2172098 RepID=A0A2S1SGH9_9FLAO|nr:DUF3857 domain-containing protein [Flavobacterium pallidum]AWI25518.1 DUF3857 domain-containing protein [Flavobacterium pallidum]
MKVYFPCAVFLLVSWVSYCQKENFAVSLIAEELKENANAVVRLSKTDIAINSQRSMILTEKRAVTVWNEYGLDDINATAYYDSKRKINKIQATVYDASGKEIKSYKRKDFKDFSAADGFSVFQDNRLLHLDYTPVQYPFTFVFESEVETSNTALVPSWAPLEGYYISTEKSVINVTYPEPLGFKYKEDHFSTQYDLQRTEKPGSISYTAQNLRALKGEESSPKLTDIVPVVYMKVEKFNLEGVDGAAKTWEEYGKWYYDSLLTGTDELPEESRAKIKQLVGNEKDPLEIARIVYEYVQGKTRYVSIQVGIGGYKPMLAKDVDKLGYGDCKALSNYTRSLLKAVNVPAYDVLIYGDRNVRGFQPDFPALQGNHMILCIPDGDKFIWLECTSQTTPFGYQGTFTDGREALVVTPEGGRIVRTPDTPARDNSQISKGSYSVSAEGNLSGMLHISSKGTQYDSVYQHEALSAEEKDKFYKEYFLTLNNLKLEKVSYKNDRKAIDFVQDLQLSAKGFTSVTGNKMIFAANVFNTNPNTPKRYRNRENPFQITRGYYDYDEITITLPEGFDIEFLPQDFELKSKYGEYQTTLKKNTDGTLTYTRSVLINKGHYDKAEYEPYRLFREQIAKNDNAKIVLTKKL